MQPPRPIYSTRKRSAGDIPKQPQGARPNPRKGLKVTVKIDDDGTSNFALLIQNVSSSRQVRALPSVPPCLKSACAHCMLRPSPTTHSIRPLPCCPSSSLLTPQPLPSSPTQSATLTIGQPSPDDIHSPPVAISIPVVVPGLLRQSSPSPPPIPPKDPVGMIFELPKHDNSVFGMESVKSKRPIRLENAEPYQPKRYKKVTNLRCLILGERTTLPQHPTHNSPTTKKWVREKKGQRATIQNYDKVLHVLRTL